MEHKENCHDKAGKKIITTLFEETTVGLGIENQIVVFGC